VNKIDFQRWYVLKVTTMLCKKRITNKHLACRFGDERHRFYLESVCGSAVNDPTSNLCGACLLLNVQTKTQDVKTFPHGLVSGPYTKESHIFESSWYLEKVAVYGAPSSTTLELARKAQANARAGIKNTSLESLEKDVSSRNSEPTNNSSVLCSNPVAVVGATPTLSVLLHPTTPTAATNVEVKKEVKKRPSAPVAAAPVAAAPVAAVTTPKKEGKKRAPKKKKEVITPSTTVESTVLAQLGAKNQTIVVSVPDGSMIETMDTPLEVNQVVKISLRPFTHNDTVYWYDSSLDKVYKRKSDGSLGPYIGRYNSSLDSIIQAAPDSDEDCV